jgi:hypothetical protein
MLGLSYKKTGREENFPSTGPATAIFVVKEAVHETVDVPSQTTRPA